MVRIIEGNPEKGVHVLNHTGNLICLKHLFRSTAVSNIYLFKKPSHVRQVLRVTIQYKKNDVKEVVYGKVTIVGTFNNRLMLDNMVDIIY